MCLCGVNKMAMFCKKCGGIIPDVVIGMSEDRLDCKNHTKPEINFNHTKREVNINLGHKK